MPKKEAARKTPKRSLTEPRMVLAAKQCIPCGSIWRLITVFKASQRRKLGTEVKCYMCGSRIPRGRQKDRLIDWRIRKGEESVQGKSSRG